MKRILVVILVIVMLVLSVAFYSMNAISQALLQPAQITSEHSFVVERGTSYYQLLTRLSETELYDNSVWLKLAVKLEPALANIKAGTYLIRPAQPLEQTLNDIAAGREQQFSITLVEGLIFTDWLAQLNKHPHTINPMNEQSVQRWIAERQLPGNSMEGWLLADTYLFTAHTPVVSIIERAHSSMQTLLSELWSTRFPGLPYEEPYEALIMASIIEKETGVAHEREHIAGVFVNRLHQNMRLQTDPTVIYGIGEAFDGNLTRQHLRTTTPYNTYRINGLPPTPIAMPGEASLRAAFNPLVTDDLYFVSKGDGTHFFSETLEQHNQAVRQYQLNQNR
ncbi:endolytic transglycosylase MltG [Alteromonas oceanisediminis]|uniref:endolytic transglycosylase MltG n=1 Tax=Alteromonas oceanisediminis TaxID=2836180 RepID=UPI001BD98E55|nr:endolytic transglycosylase MltG [Alteromonas oceanisediminis]MBT0586431.1 endolytic transglycosylase MltG [Alteromonas oceanisediminis]